MDMSAIEIALHKSAHPVALPVANSTTARLRGWIAAHAIEFAGTIAGIDQDNEPAAKAQNPWARPVGLGRARQ
jgi:type II secretory pathway component PulK